MELLGIEGYCTLLYVANSFSYVCAYSVYTICLWVILSITRRKIFNFLGYFRVVVMLSFEHIKVTNRQFIIFLFHYVSQTRNYVGIFDTNPKTIIFLLYGIVFRNVGRGVS